MLDLFMYELEDNVWDEFGESDDHIVPHPADERGDQLRFGIDSWKKPRVNIVGATSNASDDTRFIQKKEEINLPTLIKKDTMLDKSPYSDIPNGVYPSSRDNGLVKEVTNIACEEIKASKHCFGSSNTDSVADEFSAEGTILDEMSVVDNNELLNFSLGQISSTDNSLNYFNNASKDREEGDMLYYDWPDDIGNFEDVDRMFRSCESTFGFGSLSNEDDLCWFPSSHFAEGSEDSLKWGSKLSSSGGSALNCISDNNKASVSDTNKISLLSGDNLSANTSILADNSGFGLLQSLNGSDARSATNNEPALKEQVSSHTSQAKHRNHLEGKRKERNLETGDSLHRKGNLKQFSDKLSNEISPPGVMQDKQPAGLECTITQKDNMSLQIDHGQSSGINSKCNSLPFPSPKHSSFTSNQVQSMGSLNGQLLEVPAVIYEKKEKLHHEKVLQSHHSKNLKCANNEIAAAFCGPVHSKTRQSKREVEGQNEFEAVRIVIPAEPDSSNGLESSCVSSAVDDVSPEASGFQQLQQVMGQLDIRTKLCIRDSLYRLARSAEQRHDFANANGDQNTSGDLIAELTDNGTAFLDLETDTNPIDRSIAHLLFHRPADPSVVHTNNASSHKSQTWVHRSINSSQLMAKEQIVNGADCDQS